MPRIRRDARPFGGRLGAVVAGCLALASAPAAFAQQSSAPNRVAQPQNAQPLGSQQQFVAPTPVAGPGQLPPTHLVQPGYPYLNAPMYPCPEPYVPPEVGSTVITNQAIAPHEMLYPHTYRALYPPYYFKVKGRWIMTNAGVRYREDWYLQGTDVEVKYNGHHSPFSWFHPPVINRCGLDLPNVGWRTGGLFSGNVGGLFQMN
jgi:hypothetical protein